MMSRDAPISARSRGARVSQKHTGPRARARWLKILRGFVMI